MVALLIAVTIGAAMVVEMAPRWLPAALPDVHRLSVLILTRASSCLVSYSPLSAGLCASLQAKRNLTFDDTPDLDYNDFRISLFDLCSR